MTEPPTTDAGATDSLASPASAAEAEALPSLATLVASGLALAKGLGIVAGFARIAAPALVGYLAREILDSRSATGGVPGDPAAPGPPAQGSGAQTPESPGDTEGSASEDAPETEGLPEALPVPTADAIPSDPEVAPCVADPESSEATADADVPPADETVGDETPSTAVPEEAEPDPGNFPPEDPGSSSPPEAGATDEQADGGRNPFATYGLLDVDDPDDGPPPSKVYASPALAPSPYFMADDGDEPPAASAALPAPQAAAVAPELEFPGIPGAPAPSGAVEDEEWFPTFAPGEAIDHAIPETAPGVPPEISAIPDHPVVGSDAPPAPMDPAPPAPVDDFDLDFDPIAIFLQGRESESQPSESPDPQTLATEVNDEPAFDIEPAPEILELPALEPAFARHAPTRLPESHSGASGPFELMGTPQERRPRPTIPEQRNPGREEAAVGALPPRRGLQATPPLFTAAPAAIPAHFSSPFLIAPAVDQITDSEGPETRPGTPARSKGRKSRLLPIVLLGTLASLAGGAAYLHLHPEQNPFLGAKPPREAPEPAPLPITPVKPDGSPPTLPPSGGIPPLESAAVPAATDTPALVLAPPPAAADRAAPLTEEDLAVIVKDPERTLIAFLNARTNAERLRLAHLPEGIHERMDAYTATRDEGPIPYSALIPKLSSTIPGTAIPAHLFLVITRSQPDGFPVSVEDTESGYRVDWDAFVQFNDHLLDAFFSDPASPPAPFFVVLRRSHYFDNDVPALDDKLCYRVLSPIAADVEQFAFIDTDSPVGEEASTHLSWGRAYRPVIRLEWIRKADSDPYIAITEIVRHTWRGTGVVPAPEG